MNQSTIIFGYLAAAFVVFITMRGELPIYLGFMLATPTQPASSGPAATPSGALASGSGSSGISMGDVVKIAALL